MIHNSKGYPIWLIFLLIFSTTLALYYPSLNYYFFQDDWFVLNWIKFQSFLSFFSFRTDIIYWRPITMPMFFKLNNILFGINPTGYHLVAFLFHFANIILIAKILRELKVSKKSAIFGSFIYAIAAFHFVPLSWLSTTSYIVGPTFIFLALLMFLQNKSPVSFIFYLLAILSTELSLTLIPLTLILKTNFQTLRKLLPFVTIAIVYLIARFMLFPLPRSGDYQLILNSNVLVNVFWYFAWFFNVPEKMSTLIFFSTPKASLVTALQFIKYLIVPTILISTSLLLVYQSHLKKREVLKALLVFLSGILPILLLPKHTYSMYLVIASLGLIYLISKALDKIRKFNLVVSILIFLWTLSSALTLSFTRNTHWVTNEERISKTYVDFTKSLVKNPNNNSVFIFYPASKDFNERYKITTVKGENNIRQALNNQDAIKVAYDNPTLDSLFLLHLEKLPSFNNRSVYIIDPDN